MIAAAIPAIIQAGLGVGQLIGSREAANTTRPKYTIPDSVQQAMERYKTQAQAELPGQSIMEDRIRSTVGQGVSQAQESLGGSPAILGAIANMQEGARGNLNDLGIASAQNRQANEANYSNALTNILAPYQEKQFQTNQMDPFNAAMLTSSTLGKGGIQNLYGGVKDATSVSMLSKLMDSINGNTTTNSGVGDGTSTPGIDIDDGGLQDLLEGIHLNGAMDDIMRSKGSNYGGDYNFG